MPVTRENYRQVIQLLVSDEQLPFVGIPASGIADCHFCPEMSMLAAKESKSDIIVAFLILEKKPGLIKIRRFMIDCLHQHKGYGRAALDALLASLVHSEEVDHSDSVRVEVSVSVENYDLIRLYKKAGFSMSPKPGNDNILVGVTTALKIPYNSRPNVPDRT